MLKVARAALLLVLAAFYLTAATEHARVVNTFKARGDQSGYLGDAEQAYANWHGQSPPMLIGERNRMPLYAGYLALAYDPHLSDPEFFEIGKIWSIRLSLGLVAVLAAIFFWYLPPLPATNLTLIVAFGFFIFKAGYTQSDLLFYFLFFCAFLALSRLFDKRALRSSLLLAMLAGTLAALAHLTKASGLPLVAIFLAAYGGREAIALMRTREVGPFLRRIAAAALMTACFLAVLYPYISTSKRTFGRYFYNVNTTFYMWYDDWPQASIGTIKHGDGVGWPTMPEEQLPGMRKYWRDHTVGQIADRLGGGVRDMVVRSYNTYSYLKYVVLYSVFALALIAANRRAFVSLVVDRAGLFAFLLLYGVIYFVATAFYWPVSGTGTTRFLLAHVAPLLFVLSRFSMREPFRQTRWTIGGVQVTPGHVHLFVVVAMMFDLGFTVWPRLMTTYGGF